MASENKLALFGGSPILKEAFPQYNTIGQAEISGALEVLQTGVLSGFVASPNSNYFGGRWTLELEEYFCKKFGTKYAVAVNSATSGLHAALAAAGVKRGDEVIVSPYSMSASATAIVMCGGIPIFVDVEPDTFCLDAKQVKTAITSKTKAIMAVNIFGQPSNLEELRKIADQHKLYLIEDNAQAPAAKLKEKYTATFGDLGVFSLNRHKTMHCGEGGVVICNDENLARRVQMVRNHGEVVLAEWEKLQGFGNEDIIGYNYRLTELQCAIVLPQLKRLDELNSHRIELANYLKLQLGQFDFIQPPVIRSECSHVYYLFPMLIDEKKLNISRDNLVDALKAEGMPVANYVTPLYKIPLYAHHAPEKISNYNPENFPVTETLANKTMMVTSICRPPLSKKDVDLFISAIKKVVENKSNFKN